MLLSHVLQHMTQIAACCQQICAALCFSNTQMQLSLMTCMSYRPEFPPDGFSTPPAASRALHGLSQRPSLHKVSATKQVFVSPLRQSSPMQVGITQQLSCLRVWLVPSGRLTHVPPTAQLTILYKAAWAASLAKVTAQLMSTITSPLQISDHSTITSPLQISDQHSCISCVFG